MGSFLAYVFLVVFLILLTLWFLRVVLWAIGFGRWACSKGWHWYKTFPLHKHYGLTERTTTYLAVAGRKIHQCRTCGDFNPPEGKVVHEQWTRGGVASVGGTIFSGPKMEMDREAARRIGATLARTAAATPLSKPEKAPPRWMVVLGSTAIVQALGIYLVLAAGCAAMISLVGAITSQKSGESAELLVWAGGLSGFAWFVARLVDAGSSRHISRSHAAEATSDPLNYYERAAKIAREHGMEMPADVRPEALGESARRRAEKE